MGQSNKDRQLPSKQTSNKNSELQQGNSSRSLDGPKAEPSIYPDFWESGFVQYSGWKKIKIRLPKSLPRHPYTIKPQHSKTLLCLDTTNKISGYYKRVVHQQIKTRSQVIRKLVLRNSTIIKEKSVC